MDCPQLQAGPGAYIQHADRAVKRKASGNFPVQSTLLAAVGDNFLQPGGEFTLRKPPHHFLLYGSPLWIDN